MLDSEFMRLAFAAGAVIGVLAPAVGFFLVQRNMSLVGDGIGHTAFAGVALGYLLGVSPVLTALLAAVAGAVGIEWLRSRRRTRTVGATGFGATCRPAQAARSAPRRTTCVAPAPPRARC